MWSKSGRGGGVGGRFIREGKVGSCRGSWESGCSLSASICSRDGRSFWCNGCSRGRDSWRKLPMIGIGWSMVLTI